MSIYLERCCLKRAENASFADIRNAKKGQQQNFDAFALLLAQV